MSADKEQGMEALQKNRMLKGLSSEQIRSFRNAGHLIAIGPDDIVIRQADVNAHLYMVLSGELDVYLPERDDATKGINLATHHAGDFFGEYAYLDPAPASASVKATQLSVLLRVSHSSLDDLLDSDPYMGRVVYKNLLSNLVVRLRETNEELDLFRPFS